MVGSTEVWMSIGEIRSLARNDLQDALLADDTNKSIEILERIKELANASIITLSKTGGGLL